MKRRPAKAQFPQGTVSCKLLFTNAPLTQVPYLKSVGAATPVSSSYQSLGYSLQLQSGFAKFASAHPGGAGSASHAAAPRAVPLVPEVKR
jgi:hypothetical protein